MDAVQLSKIALVACMLVVRVAEAGPADDAFDRGRALMEAKKYTDACAAFEESLRLDFQFGTLYNVATCNAEIGKLASALKGLRKIARDDVNPTRKQTANDLAAKLTPRVPRLVIAVANRPAGMHVQLDGDLVDDEIGVEIPVDIGSHTITATAPNAPDQKQSVTIKKEAELAKVELSFGAPIVVGPVGSVGRPVAPRSSRAETGRIVLVSGGVVLVAGIVIGAIALKDWNVAQTDATADVTGANAEVRHVQRLGDASTVCVAVGVVAIAAGVYLWRSGSGSTVIAPSVGADGAGATLSGRF